VYFSIHFSDIIRLKLVSITFRSASYTIVERNRFLGSLGYGVNVSKQIEFKLKNVEHGAY
jgi:hypothetical protein